MSKSSNSKALPTKPSREFSALVDIMAALRDPETGCPWDVEQDFRSIRHFTIEEAYEVADAIERNDFDDLCTELGDLLLQPVFHAQMAREEKLFDIGDVIYAITDKLIRRHPHIFDKDNQLSAEQVLNQWEDIKALERNNKAQKGNKTAGQKPTEQEPSGQESSEQEPLSLLHDVPKPLPALARAEKLSKRVAKVGFDWPDIDGILHKIREELDEVEVEIKAQNQAKTHDEIGDLLFAIVSLARKSKVSPEAALSDANAKFTRRFQHVEKRCTEKNIAIADAGIEQLQKFWEEIRKSDKA
ncbi:Nucleoside triphosphate pyrophosphohydrolase MazG [hydrothermal vent metagenome]|uniref:Nucleoside triphosphate pyrophosphohydrolase MazG n=1 Tax=hydrothermal vent metagenome TaxID=652676 RepID=A0A3B0TW49_9ZZZZ